MTDIWLTIFGPTYHDEDAATVAGNIKKAGGTGLIFFTSLYHGYRLLQRRYGRKAIYSLETDRAFWEPDMSVYKESGIKPQRSIDAADADCVAELSQACRSEGLKFSALVPVCAGERLVQDRPDLAVTNMYGAKDRLFLCYNNPTVRAYRFEMIRDLVGRYEMDALMLDKIPQTMLEQDAFGGMFDAPLRTVGSFCFCEHCRKQAAKRSIDLDAVLERCLELADRSLRVPPHIIEALRDQLVGDTEIPLLMLEEPLVRQMLEFRFATAVDLVAEIGELARELRPDITFQAAFVPPMHVGHDMTSPRAWLTIQSYKLYAGVLDEIHAIVHWSPDVVRFETARAVDAAEGRTKIVTGMRLYGATRPEEVPLLKQAALDGGAEGLHFLGYDVATDELLGQLKS